MPLSSSSSSYKDEIRKQKIASYLFPGIFLLIGFGLIIGGFCKLAPDLGSRKWPHAPGVIVQSSMDSSSSKSRRGVNESLGSYNSRKTTTYHGANVVYEYTVDGKKQTGDNIIFGKFKSGNAKKVQETLARYPEGKTVDVYYEPGNAWNAVLEPGPGFTSMLLLGFGILASLLALLMRFSLTMKPSSRLP